MLGLSTRGDTGRSLSTPRAFPLDVTVTAGTNVLDNSNARRRREHLSVDLDLFYQMKAAGLLNLNNHVLLTMDSFSAPFTVEVLERHSVITEVRIGTDGLARFPGTTLPNVATLSAFVPSVTDDATAQAQGLYYEYKDDDGSQTDTIIVAPHGGNIESGTDTMAAEMKVALDATARTASIWGGRGYGFGAQGSYERWHISSVSTCIAQHPVLDTLDTRGWSYCIGLHGQSTNNRIDLGCPTAQDAFVDTLVTALQGDAALSGVTIARTENTEIAGTSLNNLGNRLSPSHYVQVEMGPNVRASSTMRAAIVSKFATAYGAL